MLVSRALRTYLVTLTIDLASPISSPSSALNMSDLILDISSSLTFLDYVPAPTSQPGAAAIVSTSQCSKPVLHSLSSRFRSTMTPLGSPIGIYCHLLTYAVTNCLSMLTAGAPKTPKLSPILSSVRLCTNADFSIQGYLPDSIKDLIVPSVLSPSVSTLLCKPATRRHIALPLLDTTSLLSSASSSVVSSPGGLITPTDGFDDSDTNLSAVDSYFGRYTPIHSSEKHLDGLPFSFSACDDQDTPHLDYFGASSEESVVDGLAKSNLQTLKPSPYSAPIIIVSPPSSEDFRSLEYRQPMGLEQSVSFTGSCLDSVPEELEPDDHGILSFVHGDAVYSTTGEDDSADFTNTRKLNSSTGEEVFLKMVERNTMEAEILKTICSVRSPNAERPVAVFEDGSWAYCVFVCAILHIPDVY